MTTVSVVVVFCASFIENIGLIYLVDNCEKAYAVKQSCVVLTVAVGDNLVVDFFDNDGDHHQLYRLHHRRRGRSCRRHCRGREGNRLVSSSSRVLVFDGVFAVFVLIIM